MEKKKKGGKRKLKQIAVNEERLMTVEERRAAIPYELVEADGKGVGVFLGISMVQTKCPNCGNVFRFEQPDDKPAPFTTQHP
jgi:hypothetical protein